MIGQRIPGGSPGLPGTNFQTVEKPRRTKKWVSDFKAEYGDDRVTNYPMEAAQHHGFTWWKQAVEQLAPPTSHKSAGHRGFFLRSVSLPLLKAL